MAKHQTPACRNQAGFTLVELAIVMIIIGLLIAGVLKGQALITNAQITSTVAQVKAIEAATTTFRDQYNDMPGDMLTPTTRLSNCTVANKCGIVGDGDGKVDNGSTTTGLNFSAAPATEQLGYWAQLSAANLLTGLNPSLGVIAWGDAEPASKISGGGFDVAWFAGNATFPAQANGIAASVAAGHYLGLHGLPGVAMAASAADGFLTPNQATRIDTKIDDGVGNTGTVLAGGLAACSTAAGVYNESAAGAQCSLYIQIQN